MEAFYGPGAGSRAATGRMLPGMRDLLARSSPVQAFRELRRDFGRVVFVLAAGDLVASFGFSLVFPFLTIYIVESFGASAFEAGLVLTLYSVVSIVSASAGGWLADRVGRRPVMIVSIGITGLIVGLMGQAADLVQIAILTLALGMVDPAFIPAARAAIADVVPEERRPRAYGLLAVAASVGWIAGPAIGAGLSRLGYPLLFAIAGSIIAIYALIALRWLPETRPVPGGPQAATEPRTVGADQDPVGAAPPAAAGAADPSRRASTGDPTPGSPSAPATPAAVRPMLVLAAFLPLAVVLHGASFVWVTTLPIAASTELGVSTDTWGILFSLNGLMIVLFQMRVAAGSERRSKPLMMALAALFYAAGYAIVALITVGPGLAVAGLAAVIVTVTIGEMLLYPLEASFVSDLAPVDVRGRYQGIALAAASLGTALAPPVTGWVLDRAPGPVLWLLVAAAAVFCALGLALLSRLAARLPPAASPVGLPIGGVPGSPEVAP
ncbi:MAG: mdtH 1 [Chloroflexi bacterium]|nr:mdtH 1 [Chloroflexota bacterium]